jgi:separase
VEQDKFWNQATKFGATLVNSVASDVNSMDNATRIILNHFSGLVDIAERRNDTGAFLTGRGFYGFCEYWMKFAKRVRHVTVMHLHDANRHIRQGI